MLDQQPRYDSYKDSGVPWIGAIPSDWDVLPGRACLYESSEKNTGMKEDTVLSLSYGRVKVKPVAEQFGLVPESYETYQIVQPGDIIIRGTDLQNDVTSLRTGLAKDHGIITSAYINLRPRSNVSPFYLHYLLSNYDDMKVFYGLGSGLRQNLSYDDFKYMGITVPDLDTQNRIVNFLNEKTAEIDAAIEKKRRLIDLLNEQKAILINRAVTKGLNPDTPKKDSGVDWIGKIPAHWGVKRVKHFTEILPGYAFPSAKFSEDETPIRLMRGVNINPGKTAWNEVVYWPEKDYAEHLRYSLKTGDLVMGMDRPWVSAGVRVARITDADLPALLVQRVARIRTAPGYSSEFLELLITSKKFLEYFEPILSGVSVPHISDGQIGNFTTAIPELDEQIEIADYCRGIAIDIGTLISKEEASILTLNEFKQTLIANAVTGKIKI